MTVAIEPSPGGSAFPGSKQERGLLQDLAAGSEARFEELVSRYIRLVLSTAFRLTRNQADAEDIAQEVFLRVFRGIKTYDPSRPFLPWLYRVTLNETYSRMRRRRRRVEVSAEETSPSQEPAVSSNVEEALATRELARRAEEIIAELPPEQGTVLWMHDIAGVSAATLSELLHLPEPTIKSRLHRGRLLVRKRLLGIPVDPPGPRAFARRPPVAPEQRVTRHEVVESLLLDYLEGRLEAEDRARFEEHIRHCDECRTFVESYSQMVRGLSRMPEPQMPPEMVHTTLAFLRESLEKGRYLQRDWTRGLPAAFGRGLRRLWRRGA